MHAFSMEFLEKALNSSERIHHHYLARKGRYPVLHEGICGFLDSAYQHHLHHLHNRLLHATTIHSDLIPALRELSRILHNGEHFVRLCSDSNAERWLQRAILLALSRDGILVHLCDFLWCICLVHQAIDHAATVTETEAHCAEWCTPEFFFSQKSYVDLALEISALQALEKEDAHALIQALMEMNPGDHGKADPIVEFLFHRLRRSRGPALRKHLLVRGEEFIPKGILGWGGFGCVQRIEWLGEEYAQKCIPNVNRAMFENEATILATLRHPHAMLCVCYSEHKRYSSMVMERMEYNLAEFIQERRKLHSPFLGLPVAVDIMLQIARGMAYLHSKNIIHRDLKPHNILVNVDPVFDEDGNVTGINEHGYVRVKVSDFGLGKLKQSNYSKFTTTKIGTGYWRAPELLATDEEKVDTKYTLKADVYSFAVVCYELLTGERPWNRNTRSNSDWRPCWPPAARVPVCLSSYIERCWDGQPSNRPSFVEICKTIMHLKGVLLRCQSPDDLDSDLLVSTVASMQQTFMPGDVAKASTTAYMTYEMFAVRIIAEHHDAGAFPCSEAHFAEHHDAEVFPCSEAKPHPPEHPHATRVSWPDKFFAYAFGTPVLSSHECVPDVDVRVPVGLERVGLLQCCFNDACIPDVDVRVPDVDMLVHGNRPLDRALESSKRIQQCYHEAVNKPRRYPLLHKGVCGFLASAYQSHLQHLHNHLLQAFPVTNRLPPDLRPAFSELSRIVHNGELFVRLCCNSNADSWPQNSILLAPSRDGVLVHLHDLLWCVCVVHQAIHSAAATDAKVHCMERSTPDFFYSVKPYGDLALDVSKLEALEKEDARNLIHELRKMVERGDHGNDRRIAEVLIHRLADTEGGHGLPNDLLVPEVEIVPKGVLGFGQSAPVQAIEWLGKELAEKSIAANETGENLFESEEDKVVESAFEREVGILVTLRHPHAVFFLCCCKYKKYSSIVMEKMEHDLAEFIQNRRELGYPSRFRLPVAVDIMLQIAKGMAYLHSENIIHRDLKPKNILVNVDPALDMRGKVIGPNRDGYVRVKLADFGVSKRKLLNESGFTTPQIGTGYWRAPELLTGENTKYTLKADVYSFAIVCYEILTSEQPWDPTTKSNTGWRPSWPSAARVPVYLSSYIQRCWDAEPSNRPAFTEICKTLTHFKGVLLRCRSPESLTVLSSPEPIKLKPIPNAPEDIVKESFLYTQLSGMPYEMFALRVMEEVRVKRDGGATSVAMETWYKRLFSGFLEKCCCRRLNSSTFSV